jgi:hypothetical protein
VEWKINYLLGIFYILVAGSIPAIKLTLVNIEQPKALSNQNKVAISSKAEETKLQAAFMSNSVNILC